MCPQQSVTDINIDKFYSRLLLEEDQVGRDVLLKLLVDEENKLGKKQEQTMIVREKISHADLIIERQRLILGEILGKKSDPTHASRMLANFIETRRLLQSLLDILIGGGHSNSAVQDPLHSRDNGIK